MKLCLHLFILSSVLAASAAAAITYTSGPGFPNVPCDRGLFADQCQYVDMDGDGVRDFYFGARGDGAYLIPFGSNRILSDPAIYPELGRYTVTMLGGELIGAVPTFGFWNGHLDYVNQFDNGSLIYMCNGRLIGLPPQCVSTIPGNGSVRYMGVEFVSGGSLHFGWVSVSAALLTTSHRLRVHGWAYETTADQALPAGYVPEPSAMLTTLAALGFFLTRRRKHPAV